MIPICFQNFFIFTVLLISRSSATSSQSQCDAQLVESIPDGVKFEQDLGLKSTHSTFLDIIRGSKQSLQIASFYWSMFCSDVNNSIPSSCQKGEEVMQALTDALQAKVSVQIAFSGKTEDIDKNEDLKLLRENGAQVVGVDFERLLGSGILHTKFMIADNKTLYIGSANMDWRSLTEVKEIGIYIQNCPLVAQDLEKIFQTYWILGQPGSQVPSKWPAYLSTVYNMDNPMQINLSGHQAKLYISNSPPALNPPGRTNDIDALVKVIRSANSTIGIEVMDYMQTFYGSQKYWPVIDNALREAVFQKPININFLGTRWKYTKRNMLLSLKSLNKLRYVKWGGSINVKLLTVPSTEAQSLVDHSRVNHCKFIVTDNMLYLSTNNWSPNYFEKTAGVSFSLMFDSPALESSDSVDLRTRLEQVHARDWHSEYSTYIPA
ncbi:5'-3' exonuclease PLD3-like [Brevipalpus obovatus]|uniref:5'-3' exonuclease PLD3-like n=1 Tax=Brevipalpus obovatus TaxID=246614 RepID=UPI003D9F739D